MPIKNTFTSPIAIPSVLWMVAVIVISLFSIAPAHAGGDPVVQMLDRAYQRKVKARLPGFCASGKYAWLKISNGRVVGTKNPYNMMTELKGFGARTKGGLGGKLWIVKSAQDPARDDAKNPTSLRGIVLAIRRSKQPGWVVFAPNMKNKRITLRAEIKLPNNITIDGTCSNVSFTSIVTNNILAVRGSKNIIITGLTFTKKKYNDLNRRTRDGISLIGSPDLVWIHRNRFVRCGDGCIDIASLTHPSNKVRVTVSRNVFGNHNKVMLIGSLVCSVNKKLPECKTNSTGKLGKLARPLIYVSVYNNFFYHTSQRHPKVYSQSYAHVANNVYVIKPTTYRTGKKSASYGVAVDRGGAAMVEENLFTAATKRAFVAATFNVNVGFMAQHNNYRTSDQLRFAKSHRLKSMANNSVVKGTRILHRNRFGSKALFAACIVNRAGPPSSPWPMKKAAGCPR